MHRWLPLGAGVVLLLTCLALTSCGENRWYPTDPRLVKPDPSRAVVTERWSVTVGISTTTTAAALQTAEWR